MTEQPTKTLPTFRLTEQQRAMAARHGAKFCSVCGRPFWSKTGPDCDEHVHWAATLLAPKATHVPGETAAQRAARTEPLDKASGA
jgi:hypothetical protein